MSQRNAMYRLNTRVPFSVDDFVKAEVKKSKNVLTEGEVYRALLDEAIINRKNK